MYMSTSSMSSDTPEEGINIPLQMVVSHHVVAGNWTQDLWKSSQCSYPLSHLSNPPEILHFFVFFKFIYLLYVSTL